MTRIALPALCLAGGIALGAAIAVASQPHMTNALASLQNAHAELQRAEANKGGHRERAIELVNRAIEETRAGIAFAR